MGRKATRELGGGERVPVEVSQVSGRVGSLGGSFAGRLAVGGVAAVGITRSQYLLHLFGISEERSDALYIYEL